MKTKLAHLQENLWSADIEFTPEELKEMTDALSKISGRRPLYGAAGATGAELSRLLDFCIFLFEKLKFRQIKHYKFVRLNCRIYGQV